MWPVKSGLIFSSSLLLTILGKVPFECLPARGLFNSLCLLRERRKGAQGYIVESGCTFLIWTALNPSYREDNLCWRATLINLLGEEGEDAEWVRLWLPNAEVMLDSSLPLMPYIQFITHFIGFTFQKPDTSRNQTLLIAFHLAWLLKLPSYLTRFPAKLPLHFYHSSHSLFSTCTKSSLLRHISDELIFSSAAFSGLLSHVEQKLESSSDL